MKVNSQMFVHFVPYQLLHSTIHSPFVSARLHVSCHIHHWYTTLLYLWTFPTTSIHSRPPHLSTLHIFRTSSPVMALSFTLLFSSHTFNTFLTPSIPLALRHSTIHPPISAELPTKKWSDIPPLSPLHTFAFNHTYMLL